MCLIVIAIQSHPIYPLVIAANRDEFYHRPTAPLDFWKDHGNVMTDVLAGRDIQGQGTWLGVTKTGRFAAITNYRDPKAIDPQAISRGLLVSNFLESDLAAEAYLQTIADSDKKYNGFNLVVGHLLDAEGRLSPALWWYSNKKNEILKIATGIHGVSNHLMDTPWPKTRKAANGIRNILAEQNPIDPERIFTLMADTERPPDAELPNTGVGLEWERILSSVFVTSHSYGTRSTAVILADRYGHLTFYERAFKSGVELPAMEAARKFDIRLK